jgi:hypothetical protein
VEWVQRCWNGCERVRYVHMVQDKDIGMSGGQMSKGKWI